MSPFHRIRQNLSILSQLHCRISGSQPGRCCAWPAHPARRPGGHRSPRRAPPAAKRSASPGRAPQKEDFSTESEKGVLRSHLGGVPSTQSLHLDNSIVYLYILSCNMMKTYKNTLSFIVFVFFLEAVPCLSSKAKPLSTSLMARRCR